MIMSIHLMVRHASTSDLASTACSQRPSRQAASEEAKCINNPVTDADVARPDSGAGRTASLLLAAVAAAALM